MLIPSVSNKNFKYKDLFIQIFIMLQELHELTQRRHIGADP